MNNLKHEWFRTLIDSQGQDEIINPVLFEFPLEYYDFTIKIMIFSSIDWFNNENKVYMIKHYSMIRIVSRV